jgi:xylulokinase
MGTSGVVFAHSDEMAFDEGGRVHTFCHAVKGKWCVLGCILSAGGAFQWYRDHFGQAEAADAKKQGTDVFSILTQQASDVPIGSEGLFFPALSHRRTYASRRSIRPAPPGSGSVFVTARPTWCEPSWKGATYAMRDALEIVKGMNIPVKEIRLTGGGGKSPLWKQMQADIYGQSVSTLSAEEGPAFGVALLAATGTGAYKSIEEASKATTHVTETTPTDKARPERIRSLLSPLRRPVSFL